MKLKSKSPSCALKIRVETNPDDLADWLAVNAYPLPWSTETLRSHCIILRVETPSAYPEAFIWAYWKMPGVLDFHVCARRRLWLTPDIINRLYMIAELFGAHSLITTPHGERAPLIRRLLFNMGFEREGDAMFTRLEEPRGFVLGSQYPDRFYADPAASS